MDKKIYASLVLQLFFDDPEACMHIREIARQTRLHPNTVLRDVLLLAKESLLLTRKTKAVLEVRGNRDNPLFTQLKRLSNFRRIMLSGVVEFLNDAYGAPEAILLFGSYSRGEDTKKSDIDLAVVTTREQHLNLSKFESILKRSIHIIEIDLSKVSKNLLTSLANSIILKGYLAI